MEKIQFLLFRVMARVFRSHSYVLFERPCADAVFPEPVADNLHLVLRCDNLNQNKMVCEALLAMNESNREYLEDIRRGLIIGFVILCNKKLVHASYLFLKNKTTCILGLQSRTGLIGNDFTLPEYRGRGYQPQSVMARAALARDFGFEYIAAETSPDNTASQRGLQKGGMRLVGRLDLVVILNILVLRLRRPRGFALFNICI